MIFKYSRHRKDKLGTNLLSLNIRLEFKEDLRCTNLSRTNILALNAKTTGAPSPLLIQSSTNCSLGFSFTVKPSTVEQSEEMYNEGCAHSYDAKPRIIYYFFYPYHFPPLFTSEPRAKSLFYYCTIVLSIIKAIGYM